MINLFKVWIHRKRSPIDDARLHTVLQLSRRRNQEAMEKIDGMMATLDGCGDRWFLQPIVPIDECQPPDDNGGKNTQ